MGDSRRDQRVVTIAAAMAATPDKTLPQLFAHTYDLKAAYNLFQHPEATPDNLQAYHREAVFEQLQQPGGYLLLEDTSELSWAGNQPRSGLGPIGSGASGLQGFHLHSTLAVRWSMKASKFDHQALPVKRSAVEVIGLADQHYHIGQPRPAGEKAKDSKVRQQRQRESQWWEETTQRLAEAPEANHIEWLRVADRGADIYEFLRSCQEYGHGFVVRAAQDRLLSDEQGRDKCGRLMASLQQEASVGEFDLELRSRGGRAARVAHLKISLQAVYLRAPQRPGKSAGQLPPVRCYALRVWEEEPPSNDEKLEWILLTNLAVTNFCEALEVVLIYATRWLIEEFHKALKSGTKAEDLQLESAEGLFAAIVIKSVVALRLLELRERVRQEPGAAVSESGLSEIEVEVLQAATGRKIKTVKEVALAIGRLGGHLNRKADGMPGWQSLWRGMAKLTTLVEGVRLAMKLKKIE
ncbi:MAG: IS4 family transposase [Acidobacteria bacterium]|nr:IS4 family transposase [Acidobacteriota bacterium]